MRKIAICDDEPYIREMLCDYLNSLQEKINQQFLITCYTNGEDLLKQMNPDTDLLLLDIKMGDLSGMQAAHRLRAAGLNTCIIFITSMVQYALEGYEVHAFAFIRKPLRYPQFERTILAALQALESQAKHNLLLRRGNTLDSISIDSILYVETLDHTSVVVTENGRMEYNISLSKIAAELDACGFGICHKSYLVNFRQIRSIQSASLLLSDQESLPISKHRRKYFLEQFTKYMGGLL